jgi:hypothetical protein
VRDAAYFKSYMAAGLLVVKDTVVVSQLRPPSI